MLLKTLLNHCYKLSSFVFTTVTFSTKNNNEEIIIDIESRKNGKKRCSKCNKLGVPSTNRFLCEACFRNGESFAEFKKENAGDSYELNKRVTEILHETNIKLGEKQVVRYNNKNTSQEKLWKLVNVCR